ncbi:MAG: SRPBCC family protein [Solirubrobacteraceae bacterium]|nr:SRPBCC family protein [Solirubrobacteraceae bacterium]
MAKLTGTATGEIDAPIDTVWAAVADVDAWPTWQKHLGEIVVTDRDAAGLPATARMATDAKVKTLRSTVRFTADAPTRLAWRQERGDVPSLEGSWALRDLGDGRTEVTYALNIDPGFTFGMLLRGDVEAKVRNSLVTRRPDELRARVTSG